MPKVVKRRTLKPRPRHIGPHKRDSAATRHEILMSARRLFTERGYDGAGVREIAAGAGVTAMLVNRYFGSKEKLFAEVAQVMMAEPMILSHANLEGPDRARQMAQVLAAITEPGMLPLEGFQLMLRSAASETAARIGGAEIDKRYQKLLVESLRGPHAAERASLLFAVVAGVQFMRQSLRLTALTNAKGTVLTGLLTKLLEPLVGDDE